MHSAALHLSRVLFTLFASNQVHCTSVRAQVPQFAVVSDLRGTDADINCMTVSLSVQWCDPCLLSYCTRSVKNGQFLKVCNSRI